MPIEIVILRRDTPVVIGAWRVERNQAADIVAVSFSPKLPPMPHSDRWRQVAKGLTVSKNGGRRFGLRQILNLLETVWSHSSSESEELPVDVFFCIGGDSIDDYELLEQSLICAHENRCGSRMYIAKDRVISFTPEQEKNLRFLDEWFEIILKYWVTDLIEVNLKGVRELKQELIRELRGGALKSSHRLAAVRRFQFKREWVFDLPPLSFSLKTFIESLRSSKKTTCTHLVVVDVTTDIPVEEVKKRKNNSSLLVAAVELGGDGNSDKMKPLREYCKKHEIALFECESIYELRFLMMQLLRPKVFVVMPFRKNSDGIYQSIKKACRQHGLLVKRADDVSGATYILSSIYELIHESDLVICDLTHERPNVYYELGYTHAKGIHHHQNILLVAEEGTKIHFDVSGFNYSDYNNRNLQQVVSKNLEVMLKH